MYRQIPMVLTRGRDVRCNASCTDFAIARAGMYNTVDAHSVHLLELVHYA